MRIRHLINTQNFLSNLGKGVLGTCTLTALLGIGVSCSSLNNPTDELEVSNRVSEIAQARELPPGAPRYADVSFSSRQPRPKTPPYRETFEAAWLFHATRFDWVNSVDNNFVSMVHDGGYSFLSLSVGGSDQKDPDGINFLVGRQETPKGAILGVPHLDYKDPQPAYGCVNKPDWREIVWKSWVKQCLDAGADGIQHAGAEINGNSVTKGGCYCDYCVAGFRHYLETNATYAQLMDWGITDISTFSFRDYVNSVGNGVTFDDDDGRYQGVPQELHDLFVQFQKKSTEQFHIEMHQFINQYAGRYVPYSCNNGSTQNWEPHLRPFDFGYSELQTKWAYPENLWARFLEARNLGKAQVVSAPKPTSSIDVDEYRRLTRKVIAITYAMGGHTSAPWDVYMPSPMPRYYGEPEEYADLYGFIRASVQYLNGYEDAAAIGAADPVNPRDSYTITEERYGSNLPVDIEGGSSKVYGFVRAYPGKATMPAVVHLIDWSENPEPFSVKVRMEHFFDGKQLSVKLLVPPPYERGAHSKAEETKDYTALSKTVLIEVQTEGEGNLTVVQIPVLNPWGMLVVSPR